LFGLAGGYETIKEPENIEILFIAGFGPIARDAGLSQRFYREALGISFKEENGGYLHTEAVPGAKIFALWPLPQAAHSCFGKDVWPGEYPAPQAWLEFDVESVETATAELERQGDQVLLRKKEPWANGNPSAQPRRIISRDYLHALDERKEIEFKALRLRPEWADPGQRGRVRTGR
jgi:hypothetical protein